MNKSHRTLMLATAALSAAAVAALALFREPPAAQPEISDRKPRHGQVKPQADPGLLVPLSNQSKSGLTRPSATTVVKPSSETDKFKSVQEEMFTECKAALSKTHDTMSGQTPETQPQNQPTLEHYIKVTSQISDTGAMLLSAMNLSLKSKTCNPQDCAATNTLKSDSHISSLIKSANSTKSPTAYGWALAACKSGFAVNEQGRTACQGINARIWARIDPQNGWAHLSMANEADIAGDLSGVINALNHAARATKWISPVDELINIIPNEGDKAPSEAASALVSQLNAMRSGAEGGGMVLILHCGGTNNVNMTDACKSILSGIANSATTLSQQSLVKRVEAKISNLAGTSAASPDMPIITTSDSGGKKIDEDVDLTCKSFALNRARTSRPLDTEIKK